MPTVAVPRFPSRNWAPEWRAWLSLADFAATAWASLDPSGQPGWPGSVPKPSAVPPAGLNWPALTPAAEIHKLVIAASDERADALGEITAQADEFISWFLNALSARPGAYPKTTLVLSIASLVATLPAMHLKELYARPRPSELCPALLPPVAVPGHASFPSGHSTQAHLMALCMKEVLHGTIYEATGFGVLWTLADRIARNREIAGLHYPSDSDAGVALAYAILPLLQAPLPGGGQSHYQAAVLAARAEWQ